MPEFYKKWGLVPTVYTSSTGLLCVHVGQTQKYFLAGSAELSILQKSFTENAYPTKATLHMLGEQLGLSKSRVASWFTCKRQSVRRAKRNKTVSKGENFRINIRVSVH